MKKIFNKLTIAAVLLIVSLVIKSPSQAHALNITPVQTVEMYSISGTPVYAAPDLRSPVVLVLDRFINVRVNGITENGFYRVDLNGDYYIPGPFLVAKLEKEKTDNQKKDDKAKDIAQVYKRQLELMSSYSGTYGLKDVTGDGIPEIISATSQEVYTYYDDGTNKSVALIYYSANPITLYYSKGQNQLLGKYKWNDREIWEVYIRDTTFVPWGQFKCISMDASPYKGKAAVVDRPYTNDATTRDGIYNKVREGM